MAIWSRWLELMPPQILVASLFTTNTIFQKQGVEISSKHLLSSKQKKIYYLAIEHLQVALEVNR